MGTGIGTRSWGEAFSVYRQPCVISMLFLGFSAGVPYLLVFSTLSAWLTEEGLSRTAIGFFSWVGITYSIKVFWAPFIDHLRLPFLHQWLGRRRSWMLLSQLCVAASLLSLTLVDPQEELVLFAALAVLVAFASATQDVVVDAYRIEASEIRYQGAMATSYILGYRLALLSSGAGALLLADQYGWSLAYTAMAGSMLVGIVTVLVIAEPGGDTKKFHPRSEDQGHESPGRVAKSPAGWVLGALVEPVSDFFRRYGRQALLILLFVGLYRISDITLGVMANPFYLDSGYSKTEIAEVSKLFGFFMTIAGAALGGVLVVRFGVAKILFLGALLIATTNLLFVVLAGMGPDLGMLALVISADNLSGGLATTAFIAYLSSLTSASHTATQYALFSSLMTLPAKFIGGFSGLLVDGFGGYPLFFIYTAAMGTPAILISYWFCRESAKQQATDDSQAKLANTIHRDP